MREVFQHKLYYKLYSSSHAHTQRSQSATTTHTHTHTARARTLSQTHKRWRSALWCHSLEVWCQKPCRRRCERWRGMKGDREKRTLCIWYYKHGWDTYLTRSADLCKHTSGCSANMSRLYCPLTSTHRQCYPTAEKSLYCGLEQPVFDTLADSS